MANWYVDNPVTFDSTSEADLNGTVKDLYIKPVDFDGTYQEVYLDKSNFKLVTQQKQTEAEVLQRVQTYGKVVM